MKVAGIVASVAWVSLLVVFVPSAASFLVVSPAMRVTTTAFPKKRNHFVDIRFFTTNTKSHQLQLSNDNDQDDVMEGGEGNFDGKGFAGYLAPYAAAFVASIAVTAAFVKFVLMDY